MKKSRWTEYVKSIREIYDRALEDRTYCDREQAAYDAATNAALWCGCKYYGIREIRDITHGAWDLAFRLRRLAIGV